MDMLRKGRKDVNMMLMGKYTTMRKFYDENENFYFYFHFILFFYMQRKLKIIKRAEFNLIFLGFVIQNFSEDKDFWMVLRFIQIKVNTLGKFWFTLDCYVNCFVKVNQIWFL